MLNLLQGLVVGGMENGVLQQVAQARQAGHDDRVVLFDHPWAGSDGEFDPGNIPLHTIQRQPGIDFRFAWKLARLLRELHPAILHARNQTGLFYGALAVRLFGPRPPRLIGTYHTAPAQSSRLARLSSAWAAQQADRVTVVSRELGRRLKHGGWIREYQTIHNGVDCQRFRPNGPGGGWRTRLRVPADALVVAHVGRFDENKRQVDLVDAFHRFRSHHPAAVLWLIGQGRHWEDVELAVREDSAITLIPRAHNMEALLREVDVFVLCSLHEALPRSLLEAMATARATVATRVGGIPELLEATDELCGVLVPPRDPAALAAALLTLVNAEYRRKIGENARRRVETSFSADRALACYETAYSELLDRRSWNPSAAS